MPQKYSFVRSKAAAVLFGLSVSTVVATVLAWAGPLPSVEVTILAVLIAPVAGVAAYFFASELQVAARHIDVLREQGLLLGIGLEKS